MSTTKIVLRVSFLAALTLFWIDHLFEIPGLIARHHQGHISKAFGPWLLYATTIAMIVLLANHTVSNTKLWLQARSAADQVR